LKNPSAVDFALPQIEGFQIENIAIPIGYAKKHI